MKFKKVMEGSVELYVPDVAVPEHGRSQGFYNPAMHMNRDISVAVASAFIQSYSDKLEHPVKVLDALSATGVRALRYKKELDNVQVYANDVNERVVDVIRKNMELNNIEIEVINKDANVLMHEQGFDIIDIDPYGSPIRFIDSGLHSLGRFGLLCITATDTAALNGAKPKVAMRRYGIKSVKCGFSKELGTRILLTAVMSKGMEQDKAFIPLLCYQERHYIRIFGMVEKGVVACNKILDDFDYVSVCECGRWHRGISRCICGSLTEIIGPVYLGKTKDKAFCEHVLSELLKRKLKGVKLLETIIHEKDIPFYYDLHKIGKIYRVDLPKANDLIKKLRKNKYKGSRTIFCDTGIKTNAGLNELLLLLKQSSE